MEPMTVKQLTIENVMRIAARSIDANGAPVVTVTGENGAGKTTILNAIWMALGGKTAIPDEPIRRGEKNGKIVVNLGDLVVTRTFTQKGSTLTVRGQDGSNYPSPQKILDGLMGALSFDPLKFITGLRPMEQLDTLKKIVGLDFAEMDKQRQTAFDARTEINRNVKSLAAQRDAIAPQEAPDEEVSVAELVAECGRRNKANAENSDERGLLANRKEDLSAGHARRASMKAELEALDKKLYTLGAQVEVQEAAVEALVDADVEEMHGQIANAEQANAAVRSKKERTRLDADREKEQAAANKLTALMNDIDEIKAAELAAAKFPVQGLGFGEGGVTYNDWPFEQASGAEQLRVSVAIGMALNKTVRVLLIRDASLLDAGNLALIGEMARENGCQVWLERVGEEKDVRVVIEEGE